MGLMVFGFGQAGEVTTTGTVTLSGTSGSPNSQASAIGSGSTQNASWEFRQDGTVWYSVNGSFTQFQTGTEWNSNQNAPVSEFWIKFTLHSGSFTTGTMNTWRQLTLVGSEDRRIIWEADAIDESVSGIIRVDINDSASDTDIIATGYYEGLANRILS